MDTYCNLIEKRAAIMAEQIALLEQFSGDMHAIMEQCDEIKYKLEELEEEEDAHDQQANLSPPLHTLPEFNHYKYFPSFDEDYYSDMEEEYAETDCFSYYCGDDGIDADDAFCTASDDDSDEDSDKDMVDCMNDQLKEHFCSRRGCHRFGCRVDH